MPAVEADGAMYWSADARTEPAAAACLSPATLGERLFQGDATLPRLLRYRSQTQGGELALR